MTAGAGNAVVVMRLLASAYSVAEKAGAIVRNVLHSGDLGIVEKVSLLPQWIFTCDSFNSCFFPTLLSSKVMQI